MMDQGGEKRRACLALPRIPSYGIVHRLALNVLYLFSKMVFHIEVPPAEGVFMRRMRTGRDDAAPEGSASSAGPPGASGDTARPNYMGPSGNGLVETDERGRNPAESRAFEWAPLSVSRRRSRGRRKTPR